MQVRTVWAVYFSGTGTTEKIVTAIAATAAERLQLSCNTLDFTSPAARERNYSFSSGDLVIFGTPVIAGRVPNVLLPFLTGHFQADHALAVPVVLYGNRNFDDALIELREILEGIGFHTVAGAAFIGEHSFSRTLGAGRPDAGRSGQSCRFRQSGSGQDCRPQHAALGAGPCKGRPSPTPLLHPSGSQRHPGQHSQGEAKDQ